MLSSESVTAPLYEAQVATWLWAPSIAQNLFHTGLSCVEQCTFVPLYSGLSCFEVVPWSLSHWLEWWCDVECEVEKVMCQPVLAARPSHAN